MMRYESTSIYKNEFVSAVKSRLGINVQDNQVDNLLKIITKACEKFDCGPLDILEIIKSGSSDSPEIEYLTTHITIGETYFFRDKRQMKMLEEYLLPKIISDKRDANNPSIRIWSAGCSSGEEIYTIAMMLKELIPDIDNWVIFLLGSDINTKQLNKALKGSYGEWSMRSISHYYKNKYFTYHEDSYQLSKSIRSMVEFTYLNLNDENYPSILNNTNAHDLIICRNVLIYFDTEASNRLMARMSLCLVNNGYFLLGASDPVNININKLVRHPEHLALLMRASAVAAAVPAKQNIIFHIDKEEEAPIARVDTKKRDKIIIKKEIVNSETVNPIQLANEGKLQEAVNEFISCIEKQKTNKQLYLELAMTLIELNRLKEAEDALKKAIFLDNKYVMAHFQLGMLMLRKNRKDEGRKYLKNALRIAQNESPGAEVPGNPGVHYGKLAEILEKELLIFYE